MSVPMIESVHFQNFKALRDTTLPLGRFTLIVGANGSGKSTALEGLRVTLQSGAFNYYQTISAEFRKQLGVNLGVTVNWKSDGVKNTSRIEFMDGGGRRTTSLIAMPSLRKVSVFSFDPKLIPNPVLMTSGVELAPDGSNLVGVLENLRDSDEKRFELLNKELNRWLPEFERIVFETPAQGQKAFLLRTSIGKHHIKAAQLSQGTLLALAYLTVAYLPEPPTIVCFEEPEHGIHPRLLRRIQDAMYRLAYPESCGETREPVQVIATTHSPYLLDLYKDHPEEVVIASKEGDNVRFERLSEKPHIEEFFHEASLGEVWYSGVLGGVPARV